MSVLGKGMDDYEEAQHEELRHMDGIGVTRPRKSPPRLPVGAVLVLSAEGPACIPVADGDKPSPWQVLAALHMQENILSPVIRADALDSMAAVDTLQALDDAFRTAHGCPPQTALWLHAFILELERARAAWFGAERSGVDPGAEERHAMARVALREVRQFLGSYPALCPVLPYWLSVPLTALLLQKFSFGRGGGGALGAKTIRALLIDPRELATYLRGAELARFFTRELALMESECVAHIHRSIAP